MTSVNGLPNGSTASTQLNAELFAVRGNETYSQQTLWLKKKNSNTAKYLGIIRVVLRGHSNEPTKTKFLRAWLPFLCRKSSLNSTDSHDHIHRLSNTKKRLTSQQNRILPIIVGASRVVNNAQIHRKFDYTCVGSVCYGAGQNFGASSSGILRSYAFRKRRRRVLEGDD